MACLTDSTEPTEDMASMASIFRTSRRTREGGIFPYDDIAEQAFGPIAVFDEDICLGWDGIPPKCQVIPELEQPELERPEDRASCQSPRFPPPALLVRATNMSPPPQMRVDEAEIDMPPPPPRLMRAESVMPRPSLAMRSNSETPAIYKIINDIINIIPQPATQPEMPTDLPSDYFDTPPPAPPKLVRHDTESAYIN